MISYFSQEPAKRYSRVKNILFAAEIFITILFLYIMATQGPSLWIRNFASRASANPWLAAAVYFAIFGIIYAVLTFWLDMYHGYSLERKFSLSTQAFSGWFMDYIKKLLIGGVLAFILVEALYFFLRRFEAAWWIFAAFFWITVSIILSKAAPVLILPLFFKVRPLEDEELRGRLLNLADKSGSRVNGVFEMDLSKKTVKANAGLAGLGRTRRILIGDTMLKDYSHDEIEVVLAHELGHHKHNHILKLMAFGAVSSFAGFYMADGVFGLLSGPLGLRGVSDLAGFPLLALILFFFTLFILPLQNSLSRAFERQADYFALDITKNPGAFISMMTKLSAQNLADETPSRFVEIFLYNHPPIAKRLKMAEEHRTLLRGA
jgi:STE24 endopeptidase